MRREFNNAPNYDRRGTYRRNYAEQHFGSGLRFLKVFAEFYEAPGLKSEECFALRKEFETFELLIIGLCPKNRTLE